MHIRGDPMKKLLTYTILLLVVLLAFIAACDKKDSITTSASPSAFYQVDQDACISCGRCVDACPHNAIQYDGETPVIIQTRCKQCGECVSVCPKDAIQ